MCSCKKYKISIVLTALGLLTQYLHAKVPEIEYNAVIKNIEFNYLIDVDGDSLSVSQTNIKEVKILNNKAKGFTKDMIFFSSFTSISDKEAYTLVPVGKKVDKIKVEQYKETGGSDGNIFYDDSRVIQFAYPSVQKDAITKLKYTISYNNPRFLRRAYMQSYIPIKKGKINLKVHRDVEIGYKIFNKEKAKINYKTYKKGKYTYHEWSFNDIEPYNYGYSKYYGASHFSPHISLYIKKTNINGMTEEYFESVDELYTYYYNFVKNVNKNASEEIKQVVKEITEGLAEEKKAKAIYYWIHKNIKYVAYEDGYAGFIPAKANEVCQKRFGDCKGMSSLIKTMMDIAGLPAHYAWVGTRSIPYTYKEMPLPAVDNHMVAAHLHNDTVVIMDGTFKYLDYGVYPYHIQGKEVLVGIDKDEYKIFKVPISPASYSVKADSVTITIDENKINGIGKAIYKGFNKLELAFAMDGVKENDYHKSFSKLLNKGNNKYKVTDEKAKNIFQYDVPAEVDYKFEVSDYVKVYEDEIYLNLNLDRPYENTIVDTINTITPIVNDFYFTERYVTRFEIPEGYEVTYVPKDSDYKNNEFKYSLKYHKENDAIILEKEIVFKFFTLLEDKFPEWNKMVKSLNKNYRQTIVLKKKN